MRYADDVVVGFQHEADAQRFWDAMCSRLAEFALSLHPEKTRSMGLAASQRSRAPNVGLANRRPSTFSASRSSADKLAADKSIHTGQVVAL